MPTNTKNITKITLIISEWFKDEPNDLKRANKIITHLVKKISDIENIVQIIEKD